MVKKRNKDVTKEDILQAALRHFSVYGYEGTSLSEIIKETGVTKPMIYYYFGNKTGLYQGLIDLAYDQSYRYFKQASQVKGDYRDRMIALVKSGFDFTVENIELARVAFATSFSAPKTIPDEIAYKEKGKRGFEVFAALIHECLEQKLLKPLDIMSLTMNLYGQMTFYIIAYLASPEEVFLSRDIAVEIVELFLNGVALADL